MYSGDSSTLERKPGSLAPLWLRAQEVEQGAAGSEELAG